RTCSCSRSSRPSWPSPCSSSASAPRPRVPMRRVEVPVLIVGAGPVGMTAAILLARQGIESLVVDRRPGPHRAPQAHVVNPRSLEIFRSAGLDRETLRRLATPRDDGSHVSWVTTLAGPELGRLPYERQGDD